MSNILQIAAGVAIIFFLPGYTLVNLLFPRKGELDPELDFVYRSALGMGLSLVISIFTGFALNALSTEEHPYVVAGPLWTVLLSMTGLFILMGWLRGAYPRAGFIHPMLYRPCSVPGTPRGKALGYKKKTRMDRLVLERESVMRDVKEFSERSSTSNPQRRLYYRKRIDQARERVEQINSELERAGEEGS